MYNTKFDILTLQNAFKEGKNIAELLRRNENSIENTPEIIELSYDIQAGSYIRDLEKYSEIINLYVVEMAKIISDRMPNSGVLLDVGSGELTTLSLLINSLKNKPIKVFAFDISWSRISKGLIFAKKTLGKDFVVLDAFCADADSIPLPDKCVDFTVTSHSLEPNGPYLSKLLHEMFRVTRKNLFLFEPYYEINSKLGQDRMDKHGYVKKISETVKNLGAKVIEIIPMKNPFNPLNPTACFVVEPPLLQKNEDIEAPRIKLNYYFTVPGTNFPLDNFENFYFSKQTGMSYPIILSIPVLKLKNGILTSGILDLGSSI
jgi:SAM-dependent methyltransferase